MEVAVSEHEYQLKIEVIAICQIHEISHISVTPPEKFARMELLIVEEFLSSCFSVPLLELPGEVPGEIHLVPEEITETEPMKDSLELLEYIQERLREFFPELDIEVCLTFGHATEDDIFLYSERNAEKKLFREPFLDTVFGSAVFYAADSELLLSEVPNLTRNFQEDSEGAHFDPALLSTYMRSRVSVTGMIRMSENPSRCKK